MPSITSYTSQIPSRFGYFKGDTAVSASYYPSQTAFTSISVGSPAGVTAVNGSSIYFNSYTNVTSWLSGATAVSITDAMIFRDMGKTLTIYVQQEKSTGGYIYNEVLNVTKAQLITTPGQASEGVTGNTSTGAGNTKDYNTVFLVTWSANPASIPIGVTRSGFD